MDLLKLYSNWASNNVPCSFSCLTQQIPFTKLPYMYFEKTLHTCKKIACLELSQYNTSYSFFRSEYKNCFIIFKTSDYAPRGL